MDWVTPQYTRTQVDKAGRILVGRNVGSTEQSLQIINNWRSAHYYPLNTFQMTLRRYARRVEDSPLVAQRIKRLSSIETKLRNETSMQLSQMQDIGGCRAVLADVKEVYDLRNLYQRSSRIKHELLKEYDYIAQPKASGYRSIHLVYKYHSDKKETFNDLKIEIQIRSQLEHAWATAVETVGTFLAQALKSSQGPERWLRFFQLMGSAIALKEDAPLVPNTPVLGSDLVRELRRYVDKLDVENMLTGYHQTISMIQETPMPGMKYFLIELRPHAGFVKVFSYKEKDLEIASDNYLGIERTLEDDPGSQAVLVSVESLESLRRAYPNYFLDTRIFLDTMNEVIS